MEKTLNLKNNGFIHLLVGFLLIFAAIALFIMKQPLTIFLAIPLFIVGLIWFFGLFIVQPNQSKVLIFFGKYKGTIKENGFFWFNPFYRKQKVSLRIRNLESNVIKVNDQDGNPILISAVVVWKVLDTYKATFNIEAKESRDVNTGMKKLQSEVAYQNFVKIQAEAALRHIAHTYPYDDLNESEEIICLRSGVEEINKTLEEELSERLDLVGIEVLEARISNLSYAPEIAAAMLQRQQAQAIIAARKKIVEGAVGMVQMALKDLTEQNVVELDTDKKAAMVSNLLVVLCSEGGTSPVINTTAHG